MPDSTVPTLSQSTVDEAALLARLRVGDDAAYELLVRTYSAPLLSVARRFFRDENDAYDALQDAFLSAFRALPNFAGDSKISTWLHRIVVNSCLMKLRSIKRRHEASIDTLLPTFHPDGHQTSSHKGWRRSEVEASAIDNETKLLVRKKIDQLPHDYRNVVLLRDIEELDTSTTAAILQISPAAVKTRLHRARQALRALLESEWQE